MMNKNIVEIIDALEAHKDNDSIRVLEELGTNSPDNEVREYTSRALVRKNLHDSLKVVIINQGKGINDLSPAVAMSTINEILAIKTYLILIDFFNIVQLIQTHEIFF